MADPFEVRLRFTNLLSHLSASATASQKTAHYALKHRDMDEDLHSCIIENLERNNMNNRANIMYFLEHFIDMAIRESHQAYVDMVRRDLPRIVDAVAPPPSSSMGGGANVKVVRRVVGSLGERGILTPEVVAEVEEKLKGREGTTGTLLEDELAAARDENAEMIDAPPAPDGVDAPQPRKTEGGSERVTPRTGPTAGLTYSAKPNGALKMDKRVIEQRIEEDRERNKRLRESVWAVGGDDGEELSKMWDEGSDVGSDDHVIAHEEIEDRKQVAKYANADS